MVLDDPCLLGTFECLPTLRSHVRQASSVTVRICACIFGECDEWRQVAAFTAFPQSSKSCVSSSAAPLPHRKNQPGSIRAVVSAESFGDEGDVVSIAGDVLETQEEHERYHPRRYFGWAIIVRVLKGVCIFP